MLILLIFLVLAPSVEAEESYPGMPYVGGSYEAKAQGIEDPPSRYGPQEDLNLNSFLTEPSIDKCVGYTYGYRYDGRPCPEGYGPVIVNTPTSDAKPWCKESYGAVIDCGRIVE